MSDLHWSIIGWTGTVIFVASFLVRDRALLHLLGLVGCMVKLVYTYHFRLWPLVVNWVLLIIIESVQWVRYRKDNAKPSLEEFFQCQL
jgi:hypothetical protein